MRKLRTVFGSVLLAVALTIVAMATPVVADRGDDDDHQNREASVESPTNGQIVFRRYFNDEQTKGALFVMNPDGSEVRRVTHPPKGWRDNVPAWSPDGQAIVFERFEADDSTSRVMVVDPDTGETRTVVPCAGKRCLYAIDPYFSPDSQSIAYARTVAPPQVQDPPEWQLYSAIFVVGVDGSDARQVSSTPSRRPGQPPAFDTTDPTFSPDGKTLACLRVRYGPEENTAVFVQPIDSPGDGRGSRHGRDAHRRAVHGGAVPVRHRSVLLTRQPVHRVRPHGRSAPRTGSSGVAALLGDLRGGGGRE